MDADCDRTFDPLANECPPIFDSAGGFDPELQGGDSTIRPTVYGSLGVDIHDRAQLDNGTAGYGDIAAGASQGKSSVVVRNDAKIGNIFGGDIFGFGSRSTVAGVHAATCDGDCILSQGPFTSPVSVGARIPDIRLTPNFPEKNGLPGPSGNGDDYDAENLYAPSNELVCNTGSTCHLYPTVTVNMAPNRYWKDLRVYSGSALRLTAGKHYFENLSFFSDSKLIVDHRQGAVEIYVRNFLFWDGSIEVDQNDQTDRTGATVLGYFGAADIHLFSSFAGTVVAPNADLELHDNQHPYSGRFFAKRVIVRPDVRISRLLCEQ